MTHDDIARKIELLSAHLKQSGKNTLHDGDFLLTWEKKAAEIETVVRCAEILKELHASGLSTRIFETGLGLAIFRDKSTRTRYAFRSGCNLLGLATEELDEKTSQVAHGETVRETATMISFASEVVGIRDDMFLGMGHHYMTEFSTALQDSFERGALPQRTGVINLQCDLDHPTQSISDLRHLSEHFGGLDALKGKKLAMTWAYSPSYGKPLSVAQGIVSLMTRYGMEVVLAHPEGYELVDAPLAAARKHAEQSGGSFQIVGSMEEAFRDADVVYPKSWAPLEIMQQRTGLLQEGAAADGPEVAELERRCLETNAQRLDWEADGDKMATTRNGEALYMHCLPADISGVSCADGEVSADVFEKYRIDTYKEASHKPFVVAALALATRASNPAEVLQQLVKEGRPRRP